MAAPFTALRGTLGLPLMRKNGPIANIQATPTSAGTPWASSRAWTRSVLGERGVCCVPTSARLPQLHQSRNQSKPSRRPLSRTKMVSRSHATRRCASGHCHAGDDRQIRRGHDYAGHASSTARWQRQACSRVAPSLFIEFAAVAAPIPLHREISVLPLGIACSVGALTGSCHRRRDREARATCCVYPGEAPSWNSTLNPRVTRRAKNGAGSTICSGIQAPGSATLPSISSRATPAAPAAAASAWA